MEINKIIVGELKTNCYIVTAKSGDTFVVDPGGDFERIKAELDQIRNMKLVYILLTHAHFDHVGALDSLKKEYPGADVIISESEVKMLRNIPAQGIYAGRLLLPVKSKICAIKDGDTLSFMGKQIRVIATPGHSSGAVCYLFEDVLFSGDTIFYRTYGRTDLPESNDIAMKKSLKRLLGLSPEIFIFPGHGKLTSVGAERNFYGLSRDHID